MSLFDPIVSFLSSDGKKLSFKDVLDPDFYEQVSGGQFDVKQALITLGAALGIGILIALVYKLTFSGVIYSFSFDVSLVLMTVITAVIIITISSNAVLSLGMVGALSIVRFRAAIKDPVDIMYLFWSISVGIVLGARQYLFALIASVIIALICIGAKLLHSRAETYLLIVSYSPQISDQMDKFIKQLGAKVRNRTSVKNDIEETSEITAELTRRKIPDQLVKKLMEKNGVYSVVLVNYNGEYCE